MATDDAPSRAAGGEPACFAHLVCNECGAVVSEGHRPGCRAGAAAAEAAVHEPAERGR